MNEVEFLFLFFEDDDWPGGALFLVGVPSMGTGLFLVGGGGLVCRSPRLFGLFECDVPFATFFLLLITSGFVATFFLLTGFAAGFLSSFFSDSDELELDLPSSAELSLLSSPLLLLSFDSLALLFSSELEFSSLLDSSSSDLSLFSLESSSALDSSFSLSSSKRNG